ncbi:hypothetical protein [Desulfovibrio gilichinskyi]|uniref:3-hydroxyacyl-[acyl-carrier-protein] dehydratase n=1 Tax=Desulfovibrio gilichinskyi TaxID=1519643 RepID=A0A1X7DT84_9BACT|nr:hypothetical protein [Desulfovibrio gilichinskyi]SMF20961.1 3-hydroxyacyl-[acyl-carrier-protein] dehydratase [Desulfovibrio gilichinskyi]
MDIHAQIKEAAGPLEIIGEETYSRTFLFKSSFSGFDGHFPNNPILPGVLQIILGEISSLEALEKKNSSQTFAIKNATRCKFLRPITPGEIILLNFTIKKNQSDYTCMCSLSIGTSKAASYQLTFAPRV